MGECDKYLLAKRDTRLVIFERELHMMCRGCCGDAECEEPPEGEDLEEFDPTS